MLHVLTTLEILTMNKYPKSKTILNGDFMDKIADHEGLKLC